MHLWCIRASQWHTWPQFPQEWGTHSETSGGERDSSPSTCFRRCPIDLGACRSLPEDAKRPDGMTLIPWEGGRSLLWDFTTCDTLAQSHPVKAIRGAGEVANYAEEQKRCQYTTLT